MEYARHIFMAILTSLLRLSNFSLFAIFRSVSIFKSLGTCCELFLVAAAVVIFEKDSAIYDQEAHPICRIYQSPQYSARFSVISPSSDDDILLIFPSILPPF